MAPVEFIRVDLSRRETRTADHLKSRRYVVADTLSVADFAIGATLPYAQAARIPIGDFPAIALWHERLNALPAWREPFPTNS